MKFVQALLILFLAVTLTGCGAVAQNTPQPLPTVVLDNTNSTPQGSTGGSSGGVTASGVVVPAEEAQMASSLSAVVKSVDVAVGDSVEAGQVLVKLAGSEKLEAAVAQAELELFNAEKEMKDLQENYVSQKAAILGSIADLNKQVRDAKYQLDNFTVPASIKDLDPMEAVETMYTRQEEARMAFEPYRNRSQYNDMREQLKDNLDSAQSDYDSAVRRLQLVIALEESQSNLKKAMDDLASLEDGPDPDEVAAVEARITAAKSSLASAQSALLDLELMAPFTGTVGKVNVHSGEWVIPGQSILELADLGHLQIETTDLSERDIPKVEVGQTVTVFIEALNLDVSGRVSEISPLASVLGGDVVYSTIIELDEQPEGLRAGMSAEVQFDSGQ